MWLAMLWIRWVAKDGSWSQLYLMQLAKMKLGPLRSTSVHLAYPENQIRHPRLVARQHLGLAAVSSLAEIELPDRLTAGVLDPEGPDMLDDGPWRREAAGRRAASQLRQHYGEWFDTKTGDQVYCVEAPAFSVASNPATACRSTASAPSSPTSPP